MAKARNAIEETLTGSVGYGLPQRESNPRRAGRYESLVFRRCGRLVIVALTGWGQEENRQRSLDAGFDTHLVKPVDQDLLMRLLTALPSYGTARPTALRSPPPSPPSS